MSVELLNAAWKADIGDPVAKLVMVYLADAVNSNSDGWCWPSIETISRITQLSERTVQRKIRHLESQGVIKAVRGRNCCKYYVDSEKLGERMITTSTPSQCHPVRLTPCHTVTPQLTHSHPATDTQSPQNGQSVSYHTDEPEMNPNGTRNEPAGETKKSARKSVVDISKITLPFESKEFAAEWADWIRFRSAKRKPVSEIAANAMFRDFVKWGEAASIESIRNSIKNDWQGIFEPKPKPNGNYAPANGNKPAKGCFDIDGREMKLPPPIDLEAMMKAKLQRTP